MTDEELQFYGAEGGDFVCDDADKIEEDRTEVDPNIMFDDGRDDDLTAYLTYRGKCKPFCEAALAADPTLTLVRGHYYCPAWGKQPHWWTVRADGTIYDPAAAQFPSRGAGTYVPFNGMIDCDQCGKTVKEDDARILGNGHYAVCSYACALRLVGLALDRSPGQAVPREERAYGA